MDARFLDSLPQERERARPSYLRGDTIGELVLRRIAVLALVASSLLGLGSEDEVVEILHDQAAPAVVVLRCALAIAAGYEVPVERLLGADFLGIARIGVGAAVEKSTLDVFLEAPF
jgi:hypothetical protein